MDALPEIEALRALLSLCGESPRVIAQALTRDRPPLREPLLPSILHACGVPWTGTGSRSRRGHDQRSL